MALVLAASACSSGGSDTRVEGMCGQPADSDAGTSLRHVLGTDDFKTNVIMSDRRFVAELKEDVQERREKSGTAPAYLCTFLPEDSDERVVLGFAWAPAEEPGEDPAQAGSLYDVSGVRGESQDLASELRVPCDLGGELSEPSRKAVLRADATLTVNRGKDVDQEMKARQLTFLYLMTREVTEALGCENKPLAKDPVVKAS
ncbi:hypothetical protein ACFVZW_03055 [Streptomyces sp. NPDC059567]|uniref:hypothetical protein n=1 Tax=Streptomyces sp. NPDC059567 TaxID=3346867 RepID=UPI0036A1640B